MTASAPTAQSQTGAVVDWIKREEHFDELRKKVLEQLRNSVSASLNTVLQDTLKEHAARLLASSKTLSQHALTPLEGQAKREVLKQLKQEIEKDLLDQATKVAWGIIVDREGELFSLMEQKVHMALCAVYGERQDHQLTQPDEAHVATGAAPHQHDPGNYNQPSTTGNGYGGYIGRQDLYGAGVASTHPAGHAAQHVPVGGGIGGGGMQSGAPHHAPYHAVPLAASGVPGPRPPPVPYPGSVPYPYHGGYGQIGGGAGTYPHAPMHQQPLPVGAYGAVPGLGSGHGAIPGVGPVHGYQQGPTMGKGL